MADSESRSRAYFAQRNIKPDEVARELEEMEPVLGTARDLRHFLYNAIQRFNGELRPTGNADEFQLLPGDLRDSMTARDSRLAFPMRVSFDGIPAPGAALLGRNHPVVAATAEAVLARALDGGSPGFARAGAVFTKAAARRTAALMLRLRYLVEADGRQQFAEEVVAAAFRMDYSNDGGTLHWLTPLQDEALRLLSEAEPVANMPPAERQEHVQWALDMLKGDWADEIIAGRVAELEASHDRLRRAVKGSKAKITPHRPPDIIGCYVLVPA